MRTSTLLLSSLLVAACSQPASAPAPAEKAAQTAPAAPAADTKVAAAATAPAAAHEDEDDGCIHKDAGKPHDEAACGHGDGDPAPDTGIPGHFGAAFALKDTKPLGAVLASAKDLKDPVQVSGTVDSVCQKMGCWLVVKDGDAQARILMKDHSFTAPLDCKGKNVVIEGTLEARTFSEAQVKHLEKDAGKDPTSVAGERTEYVLTATGLELKS
jgi:hypothetical protein